MNLYALCAIFIHSIMNKCIVYYNNFTDEEWGAIVGCKFSRFAQLLVGIYSVTTQPNSKACVLSTVLYSFLS